MRLFIALLIGKLILALIRTFKIGGGSAAPGLYALKVDPGLVSKLARRIPKNVVITGTNGKTTTARILAHLAQEAGLKVIRNHTGSNLERGIASALISRGANVIHLGGGVALHLGIWELDEAAFNSVAPKLKPNVVVFLNVFRDQLDRYGEVDSVVSKWTETIRKLPESTVVLINGDDANTLKLKEHFKGKVKTFGVEDFKIAGESLEKSTHHKLDFEAKNIKQKGLEGTDFEFRVQNAEFRIKLPIPGIYHIYDAVAALAVFSYIDILTHRLTESLADFRPAFGRVEKLPFGYIFLIKNPAGATQVFETIAPQLKPEDRLLIALNDNFADGTDVSWIWDAEFELLTNQESRGAKLSHLRGGQVIVSGSRAEDLAVRLKYAGFEGDRLQVVPGLKLALQEARRGLKGSLYVLPTYTALLEIQGIITKQKIKANYWEDK